MADIRVTSVIETDQRRLNSKSCVPSTPFWNATLGANGVVNELCSRIPVQQPRGRLPVLEGCGANSKQYVVL